jgi:hypothetical protein
VGRIRYSKDELWHIYCHLPAVRLEPCWWLTIACAESAFVFKDPGEGRPACGHGTKGGQRGVRCALGERCLVLGLRVDIRRPARFLSTRKIHILTRVVNSHIGPIVDSFRNMPVFCNGRPCIHWSTLCLQSLSAFSQPKVHTSPKLALSGAIIIEGCVLLTTSSCPGSSG